MKCWIYEDRIEVPRFKAVDFSSIVDWMSPAVPPDFTPLTSVYRGLLPEQSDCNRALRIRGTLDAAATAHASMK